MQRTLFLLLALVVQVTPVSGQATPFGNVRDGEWSGRGGSASRTFGGADDSMLGGVRNCAYNVKMDNPTVHLTLAGETVKSGSVVATMTESVVGRCPFSPIGTRTHSFALSSARWVDTTLTVDFTGSDSNEPHTTARFTGSIGRGVMSGQITFNRTDAGLEFAWHVPIAITLTKPN